MAQSSDPYQAIQSLYPQPIPDAQACEAASNLIAFLDLLIEIDSEHRITRPNTQGARS